MVKSCAIIFSDHVQIWSKYKVWGLEKSTVPLFENFENFPKKPAIQNVHFFGLCFENVIITLKWIRIEKPK
jgi:hypothetical protein